MKKSLVLSTLAAALLAAGSPVFAAAPNKLQAKAAAAQFQRLTWQDEWREFAFHWSLHELAIDGNGDKQSVTKAVEQQFGPVASVENGTDGGLVVTLERPLSRADLATKAKSTGLAIRAVGYGNAGSVGKADARQLLTRQIVVKGTAALDAKALAAGYGLRFVESIDFTPNTAVFEIISDDPLAVIEVANALHAAGGTAFATPIVQYGRQKRLIPNDPLFPQQWHLSNTGDNIADGIVGITGFDASVSRAWDTATGAGILIAIVDDGLQATHPDLSAAARTDIDRDFINNDFDAAPGSGDDHGTACAGIAGARGNNGIGVAGAALGASLVGVRVVGTNMTDTTESGALSHQTQAALAADRVQVSSNSWGPVDGVDWYTTWGSLTRTAVETAITSGRGGLGTIFVWAGGNGRAEGDDTGLDGYASSRYTIAVAASRADGQPSYYSEAGSAILVNAPSSDRGYGTTTTDLVGAEGYNPDGDYANDFGGTSSACPVVAGTVALILETNPGLNWRDVQHVLVNSVSQNDPSSADNITNGAGYVFNRDYGFGLINAARAVRLAEVWPGIPVAAAPIVVANNVARAIPDESAVEVSYVVSASDEFVVEHVEVDVVATHSYRGDLRWTLTSPSGTSVDLAIPVADETQNLTWTFTSVATWGETSTGTWKLQVADEFSGDSGSLTRSTLRLHGYLKGDFEVPPLPNTAPGLPELAAVLSIKAAAVDGEGDRLSYTYVWSSDGGDAPVTHGPTSADTDSLSAALDGVTLDPGERWTVAVSAADQGGAISRQSEAAFRIEGDGTVVFEGWLVR